MLFAVVLMMAEGSLTLYSKSVKQDDVTDSVPPQQVDTILTDRVEASAKTKRDTSMMDSLELAIYKHNKAVDDSLALDSINRRRKNGIDSPVDYSADDSLTYHANLKKANLYGSSKVKYQNMNLESERISLSLDSSQVYATGAMDSTNMELTGTPVFKMGNDE